ncbi:hypothetical protein GCM10009700_24890 [Brevibacterium sanguinis]
MITDMSLLRDECGMRRLLGQGSRLIISTAAVVRRVRRRAGTETFVTVPRVPGDRLGEG